MWHTAIADIYIALGGTILTPDEIDLLARMDTKLEFIQGKVASFCTFKDAAALDIANLKNHCDNTKDIPERVNSLEKWRTGLAYAMAVLMLLMGWGWIVVGGAK